MKIKFRLIFASLLVILTTLATVQPVQASPSRTWSQTGGMTIPRLSHTAILLLDSRVLVAGGITTGGTSTATAELYAASQGVWSATNSMGTPRSQHMATLLPNGKVLITGGSFRGVSLATSEVFDPVTDTWSSTSSMNSPRSNHMATLLSDGRVLVTGGVGSNNSAPVENSAEIYDPQTGTWSTTQHMVNARYNHQAASTLSKVW